jgi:tetratricopeptide (TPR) repeat protein
VQVPPGNRSSRKPPYTDLDRLNEAEAAFREVLEIAEPRIEANDPRLAVTRSELAQVHWKRREFDKAEPLLLRAAEIMKAAHGAESAEYGPQLNALGLLYSRWADEPGQAARRAQGVDYATKALAVTHATVGARHPATAVCYNNLAAMKAKLGDWPGAAGDAERAVAIMLSLDLAQHPTTQGTARDLAHYWEQSGQVDKVPVIRQIELQHRAWVAEDPHNRQFGPPEFSWENRRRE